MPNAAQRSKIFGAQRELRWDKEQLYDLVEQVSGARSISRMDQEQTNQVLDALVRAGARPGNGRPGKGRGKPRGRTTAPNESLLITAEQREMIDDLRGQLGGKWPEQRYYEGACVRLLKKPRPTTAGNAARVIEMLKQRLGHARGKRTAQ